MHAVQDSLLLLREHEAAMVRHACMRAQHKLRRIVDLPPSARRPSMRVWSGTDSALSSLEDTQRHASCGGIMRASDQTQVRESECCELTGVVLRQAACVLGLCPTGN